MKTPSDLSFLVNPRSVALVGASERPDSIGGRAMSNLLEHSRFGGSLYLVNRNRAEIGGRRCWPRVADLPAAPDLLIVAVPADGVMEVLREGAARGVPFAIILTSGFGEAGEKGKLVEEEMRTLAEWSGMRLYGPNCPGLCNVNRQLGFTFSPSFRHDLNKGPIGLATQGGGLGRNVMQAMARGLGVGLWASTGNEVDLQVADFIHYMADADDIKVIVTLLEGIKDGRRFLAALQHAAARGKPVVGLKVGRSEYGQRAAQSHTASVTGSAEVNSAAFRQLGLVEVDDVDELVDTAWLLARQTPSRKALAIYCSSGGTSALTADMVGSAGLELARFSEVTTQTLRARLPSYAAVGNPVDTTTAVLTNPALVDETMLAVCRDPSVGLVVLPITIDYGSTTERIAQSAVRVQQHSPVPILPIWMSDRTGSAFEILANAGMVPARSVGKAVKAIARWQEWGRWRERYDLEGPMRPLLLDLPIETSMESRALSEPAAKRWLAGAGIPVPRMEIARSEDEAAHAASRIGYPVVGKVISPAIQHKSDVGGVMVGLRDEAAVRRAWHAIHDRVRTALPDAPIEGMLIERMLPAGGVEVLVGVSRDPILGHVIAFGLGGIYVEVFRDIARRLLPLTSAEADRLLRDVRCHPLLAGARGRPPCDLPALRDLLLRVSAFVAAHGADIDEMELNPVWVGPEGQGVVALDALIVGRLGEQA